MSFPQSGIEAVVKNLDGFLSDIGKIDRSIQNIGSDTKGLSNWNDSVTSTMANVGKVVAGAAAAGTAAITAFVLDSTKQSANLESSLSGIAAVLNKGAEAVGPLKDLILDLGIDPALKVSATEAAQAVELLARNGLDMTEIMDGAARSTVLLANATNADFGTAADIATDAMAQFNIEVGNMDEAVNGITGVVNNSKFSIDDYKLAIGQAGGIAGGTGVSFSDFNAVLAGTAQFFNGGSDAGTSFKTFLQQLTPDTKPATDAMRELGLFTGLTKDEFEKAQDKVTKYKKQLADLDPTTKSYAKRSEELTEKINVLESSLINGQNAFFDLNGDMKDMDEISGILSNALEGLSEEQRATALESIFLSDASRTALGLAELGAEKFVELRDAIDATDAQQSAKTRMDNLSGSLEILNGIVETLRIRIGDKFNPVFRDLVDQVAAFLSNNSDRIVNFFGKLADMVKVAIDRFIPLVESWLPKLEKGVEDGATGIEGMITKVGEITRYIGDLTTKVIGIVKPMVDWITENYTLEDILNGLTTLVIVSLIPAITSLVTTLGPVIAVFGSIVELSSRMSEGQKGFAVAVGVAVFALPPLISAIATVSSVVTTLIGFISGAAGIVPALGALLNPIGLAVAAVAGLAIAWNRDFGGIRTKTTEVVGQVGQTINSWLTNTVSKFQETQTRIGTSLASWSNNIGTTFASLASNALTSLSRLQNEGGTVFNRFRENAVNKIGEMVRDVPQRLRELVDAGLRVFDVGKWIQAGADVIGGVLRGLQNAATAPLRWIENFASGLVGVFKSILKIASPSQVFEETGVNIMEGLQGGLEDRSGAVLGFMNQFSRDLVETSAAAQRLADAEFKKLTDSATAAYNGFVATANNIATLSQNIDQAAIAAQNAAQQAYVDSLAPAAPAADSGFGTGRVAELTRQITGIVRTSFEGVGSTGIRSLGIDLNQFQSASQVESAIAQLRLLAGTIQQNAQVAPDVNDRNRLSSLFNDLNSRILPLLSGDLAKRQAAEAAANAPAIARANLNAALTKIDEIVGYTRAFGLFGSPDQAALQNATEGQIDTFVKLNQQVKDVGAVMETITRRINSVGVEGLGAERFIKEIQSLGSYFDFITRSGDVLRGGAFGSQDRETDARLQGVFASLASATISALPVLAGGTTEMQTNVNVGSINNGMDIAALQALISQAVASALP